MPLQPLSKAKNFNQPAPNNSRQSETIIKEGAVVPHSSEAEEAVLGSLLLDRDLITVVAPVLKPRHFFSRARANFYQALLNLYSEQTPGDLVTIRNELKALGVLGEGEDQVSSSYVFHLMQSTPTPIHVKYYVNIMLNSWLARQLISEGTQLVASSYKSEVEANQLLGETVNRLQTLATSLKGREAPYLMSHERSLEHFLRVVKDQEEKSVKEASFSISNQEIPRLRFGWSEFDGKDGVEPPLLALLSSTLTTILGRTGGGKTLAALQIADANAMAGLNVLYFHVELNHEQMLARRYCRLAGVPILAQLLKTLTDGDIEALANASGKVSMWPGRVDFIHCPEWSASQLTQELKARHYALMAKTGRGYDLGILDYLQRLGWPKNCLSEREALAHNVRRFSDTLNELNIAGLMTSQVGRNEARQFEPPDLDGGLGTGEIERCSNQLLAIAISQDKLLGKFAIRKNTFGESGVCGTLTFDAKRMRFL